MAKQKIDITKKKPFTTLLTDGIAKDIKLIAVQKGKKYCDIIEEALRNYITKERMRRRT